MVYVKNSWKSTQIEFKSKLFILIKKSLINEYFSLKINALSLNNIEYFHIKTLTYYSNLFLFKLICHNENYIQWLIMLSIDFAKKGSQKELEWNK